MQDPLAHGANRRTVLKLATLGVGSLLLPGGAACWAPRAEELSLATHSGALPTDPPSSGAPPAAPVEIALAATTTPVAADSGTVPLSYDGSFPGPLLRLREGDHVRLTFTNALDTVTNLHLHGL